MLSSNLHENKRKIKAHRKELIFEALENGKRIRLGDKDLNSIRNSVLQRSCHFSYVIKLNFSKAISLSSNGMNINYTGGFGQGPNEACSGDIFFKALVVCLLC